VLTTLAGESALSKLSASERDSEVENEGLQEVSARKWIRRFSDVSDDGCFV